MGLLATEAARFALAGALGLFLGFFFDLRRALFPRQRVGISAALMDGLCWFFAILFVLGAWLLVSWGEARSYLFLGLFFGALLWALFFSRPVYVLLCRFFRAAAGLLRRAGCFWGRCSRVMLRFLSWPFAFLSRLIWRFLALLALFLRPLRRFSRWSREKWRSYRKRRRPPADEE